MGIVVFVTHYSVRIYMQMCVGIHYGYYGIVGIQKRRHVQLALPTRPDIFNYNCFLLWEGSYFICFICCS